MADRNLNALERSVLRMLLNARDRRWLTMAQIAEAIQHDRLAVQSALSSLCRVDLVVRGEHRPLERTYAITTLGEAALDRLGVEAQS